MHEPSHPNRRTTLAWLMALAGASSAASCGGSTEAPARRKASTTAAWLPSTLRA